MTVSVVVFGDGFVLILSCSIPDLQFDFSVVDIDDFVDIIDSNGHHIVLHKLALAVAQ